MGIAFRSVSSAGTTIAGSGITVPAPAGIQDGDILVAFGSAGFGAGSGTGLTGTGFSSIRDFKHTAGNLVGGYLFKRALNESGSYTFDFTGLNSGIDRTVCIFAISGAVVSGSPVHAEAISTEVSGSGVTLDVTCPDVVVTKISLVLQFTFWFMGFASITVAFVSGTASTERVDQSFTFSATQGSTVDLIGSSNPGTTTYRGTQSNAFSATAFGATVAIQELVPPGSGGIMGGDNPSILQPSRERIERGQKILNPFGTKKRACMCPVGKCRCL